MEKHKHIMLDLETMGSKSNSAIVSIGAVKFDIETGETGEVFHEKVNLQSCIDAGLKVDASTIEWWLSQSKEAQEQLMEGEKRSLFGALKAFRVFAHGDYEIWGNSARFDCGILADAYTALEQPIPWDFRKERDIRTLVSFAPEVKANHKFKGTEHNALDDCYNQIEYCVKIYNQLKTK